MNSNLTSLEEPKYDDNDVYIKHFAYSLIYNEEHEQADWVAYELLKSETIPNFKRTNRFIVDTMIYTGTATNSDYLHSGYDKGHLAPAADMTWNLQAMKESFYFSNISPQLPGFNRGIWKKLEMNVRDWAQTHNCLYITSGPIFMNSDQRIGKNNVTIPSHFYKTILIYNDSIQEAIGFIFPHKKCEGEIFDYAISIDSLELITGLNFYHRLPKRKEKKIEKDYVSKFWFKN